MELTRANLVDPEPLLHAAQAGDGAALGQLLELYRNYLLLLARFQIGRRLGHGHLACLSRSYALRFGPKKANPPSPHFHVVHPIWLDSGNFRI